MSERADAICGNAIDILVKEVKSLRKRVGELETANTFLRGILRFNEIDPCSNCWQRGNEIIHLCGKEVKND